VFKDEVRRIASNSAWPHDMVYRHPFPGPGLAVRILGEVKREYARTAAARRSHLSIENCAVTTCMSVPARHLRYSWPGCARSASWADARRYELYVIALARGRDDRLHDRALGAPAVRVPDLVSRRIVNEVPGISRVVYDISGKPPADIEWELTEPIYSARFGSAAVSFAPVGLFGEQINVPCG